MDGVDSCVTLKEIKSSGFTHNNFVQSVGKFGSVSSLEKAYLETDGNKSSVITGEIKSVLEKPTSDVLKIDIQEEASKDHPGKFFGLFAFKHAATEILNLKLNAGDLIALQGAIIEESPCYFMPSDYHKIHARITDSSVHKTKIWFMRKVSVPVTQLSEKPKFSILQKYIYHKLSGITGPKMPVHLYGIVVSQKEPSSLANKKLMVRVGLIDETACSVEKPFDLYIYCGSVETAPKIEKYQVLRAHRVKVESFNGKLDGRVFKSADIVTVDSDVANRNCVRSTAKVFDWTENDKARLLELYTWLWAQSWYRTPLNNTTQHMIEDINGPGLIKLICKIVVVRKSKDCESIVLTVSDGTFCKQHIKKIRNAEKMSLINIQSDYSSFECDQLEVDIVVTQLTDEFKLLKVGDFICFSGVNVKTHPSQSTDYRTLLSLTMNAKYGSVRLFDPHHSVAKRIKRRLSSPKVTVDERLERLESDRNIISLQDITNSSSIHPDGSIICSPEHTSPDKIISPAKKRGSENESQVQVSSANKKLKSLTDDTERGAPEMSGGSVEKTCRGAFGTHPVINPSCAVNKGEKVLNEPDPELPKVHNNEKNTPVLFFSIGNGDKALQSLQRKITESCKNQIPSPGKAISEHKSVSSPKQCKEQLLCDNIPNNVGSARALCATVCSPAKDTGNEPHYLISDTLEKDLQILFGKSENSVLQNGNSGNDNCPPEYIHATSSVPLDNNIVLPGSECISSAGTYSHFRSKIDVQVTSTQITQSHDRKEKIDLRHEKRGDDLLKILEGEEEEIGEDTVEDIHDIPQKKKLKRSPTKLKSLNYNVEHLIDTNKNCVAGISTPEDLFSTYNSHPHYSINSMHHLVENNFVGTDKKEVDARQKSKSTKTTPEGCREFDTLHSPGIVPHSVVHTHKETAHADVSSSTMSGVDVIMNEVCSNMHDVHLTARNSPHQVLDGTIAESMQVAHASKPSDQREGVGDSCEINIVQTEINSEDEIIQQSQSTSPRKSPQRGISVGENNLNKRELPLPHGQSRSPRKGGKTPVGNSPSKFLCEVDVEEAIPSFEIHPISDQWMNLDLLSKSAKCSNLQSCGSSIPCYQAQKRNCYSGTKCGQSPKPCDTNACMVQHTNERSNCTSCTSPKSVQNSQINKAKDTPCKSRHCHSASYHHETGESVADHTCLSKGISPVNTGIITGWIVDVEPSLSRVKEDLVSGYCTTCDRIKRFSHVKKLVSVTGGGLCLHCHRNGLTTVLALMYCFTLKVVIKSGRSFKILVGHPPAENLFGFTVEDYVTDGRLQILTRDYLNEITVREKAKKTAKNRVECSVIFDFEEVSLVLKQFLYLPVDFLKFKATALERLNGR